MKETYIEKTKPLSYKEWGAVLIDLYRQSVDKRKFMLAMRYGGINVHGKNITPIDFFSTTENLSDQEITESIAGYLDIQSVENHIEDMDNALYHSRNYIREYLLRELPREIMGLEITKVEDVIKIFRKTSTLKPRERQGLGPAYCELIKVMAANFMFEAKDLQHLIKETEYVYNRLFYGGGHAQPLHILRRLQNGYDKIVGVQIDEFALPGNETVVCEGYYRGKSRDSFVTKFIIKPESSVTEAVKDGIGLKMEADSKKDIVSLMGMILRELFLRFKVESVSLENTGLFDDIEYLNLKENVKYFSNKILTLTHESQDITTGSSKEVIKIINDENPNSAKNFRAIKICEGDIKIPLGGAQEAMSVERSFEVQFVLSSNSNEDGFSNHHIYEAKKKLVATTKNIGSFPVSYLDKVVQEASRKSGLGYENIKQHFYNTMLSKVMSPNSKITRLVVTRQTMKLMEAEMFSSHLRLKSLQKT